MWLQRGLLRRCGVAYSAAAATRATSATTTTTSRRWCGNDTAASNAVDGRDDKHATPSSPSPAPLDIAPRKRLARPSPSSRAALDVDALLRSLPTQPGAHAELSTAELERKISEWARLHPRELAAAVARLEAQEEESSRVLQDDALYQMDVSLRPRSAGAVRVFWRDVDVVPLTTNATTDTTDATTDNTTDNTRTQSPATRRSDAVRWYAVTVDGRKVKAFESRRVLALPSEAMALACAHEYATQAGHLNKLLMPLCDLCSGAQHVAPQRIAPRIDYLLSFYQNDNVYFRAPPIADEQDALLAPIVAWATRQYDVAVPRIVGIGHAHVPAHAVQRVRDALHAMCMNPYQVVALCVAAQFTSSLLLPLALFHGVVDVATALRVNRAEEAHNIRTSGHVAGYHDIRDADAVVKVCACAAAWRMTQHVSLAACITGPMHCQGTADDGNDDDEDDEAMMSV